MYNSKLYTILEQFDKYEQNRCRKYIESPYFNRSEELVKLYEIFLKDINRKRRRSLDKIKVWKKIQPAQSFNDVRFRKYCSDLLKLVEGYLSQEVYESNLIDKKINLIEAVGKKKLEQLYDSSIRSAKNYSKKRQIRSASFYLKNYELESKSYDLAENTHQRTIKKNIDSLNFNLDVFYITEKLRFYCSALNYKLAAEQDFNVIFIEEILEQIRERDFINIPIIAAYYHTYLSQYQENEEHHYYNLKRLLEAYALEFPQLEAMNIYVYAINYCARKINKGNQLFLKEIFDLYEDLINKQIIFVNGELSPWNFKNIVVVALRLGKYEWTENFIKKYSERLPEAFRSNAITYNLAQVYFYQKKHDKVIEQLRNVEYEDVAYNLGSKAMLLATYYETDEIEPLYSLFESFRAYLNRHKDIPYNRRQNYSNLIKFTKKLTRTMPGDSKAVEKLKSEIKSTKNIASVKWLKEKIAELEG